MHPAAKILSQALTQAGWQIISNDDLDAWWADESWRLECGGATALLTFLIDPAADVHRRKKGEKLWAVKASAHPPSKWQNDSGEVTLDFGKDWRGRIPAFVRSLDYFRTKKPNKAPEPTSGTVTPPAEPGVAPVPPVAHL